MWFFFVNNNTFTESDSTSFRMLTGGISLCRNLILPEHALHSDLTGDITFMSTNFQFRKVFKMNLFDFNLDYNLTSKRKAV